ncbi:Arm DNA-binding domain-containing protein [Denitratisoma oestradiolicum]|uniref:Integrase n=2 Tax=Denitratisoma oestradiolicum TaxID=311182 RepID=A0A6S6YB65_9PROT|nr:DUF3596 domain-containing protein [Denitratisoma oestradiolicum]TWO78742.1 site-specific integrase [Denitratisoma oestradiolicum]CAB1369844.1 Integrase [Denitratisoma oestradiolicum]
MAKVRVRKETGTLYLDFFFRGQRCREQTSLPDTVANRKKLEKVLERIEQDLQSGIFDYARYFPNSRMLIRFKPTIAPQLLPMTTLAAPTVQAAVTAPVMPDRPNFSAFAEDWQLENKVAWRRSYQRTVADIVKKHLLPAFGERDVGSLSREELLKFRSELAKVPGRKNETLSPRRINAIMNVTSLILNEASDRYKFTSPYYNIKPLRIPKSDVEPFTLNEVRQILDTVREDYRDYYTVRFFTGMRTGEVDGLKWQYIDFERRLILVRETIVQGIEGEDTKTQESNRDIQMSQLVFDALQRQLTRTGKARKYVFCTREGCPLDHNNVTKRVWYPLLRHLAFKLRRPYQTRHTAATLWLAAGENPEWIARQMGHATTEMLFKVYSRYVPNLTRRDGSAFERLLAGSFGGQEIASPQEVRHGTV